MAYRVAFIIREQTLAELLRLYFTFPPEEKLCCVFYPADDGGYYCVELSSKKKLPLRREVVIQFQRFCLETCPERIHLFAQDSTCGDSPQR
jgi:hypothetical protein